MKGWLNYNGKFIEEKTPVIAADNRGFRYGDGLFETMKVVLGRILLKELHFERLFSGMQVLDMRMAGFFSPEVLEDQVLKTLRKNQITGPARVRLMVFRGDGGLHEGSDSPGGYIIQVWPLTSSKLSLNENGLVIGLYDKGRKACDELANLKSGNYLPYVMGAIHARDNKLNDCLVLNTYGRVCDSTIANVFWVRNGNIHTPPLSEGCVAGVMRHHLLNRLAEQGFKVSEKLASVEELTQADELFLTNAINGLRWVKHFNGKTYTGETSRKIYIQTIQS